MERDAYDEFLDEKKRRKFRSNVHALIGLYLCYLAYNLVKGAFAGGEPGKHLLEVAAALLFVGVAAFLFRRWYLEDKALKEEEKKYIELFAPENADGKNTDEANGAAAGAGNAGSGQGEHRSISEIANSVPGGDDEDATS